MQVYYMRTECVSLPEVGGAHGWRAVLAAAAAAGAGGRSLGAGGGGRGALRAAAPARRRRCCCCCKQRPGSMEESVCVPLYGVSECERCV